MRWAIFVCHKLIMFWVWSGLVWQAGREADYKTTREGVEKKWLVCVCRGQIWRPRCSCWVPGRTSTRRRWTLADWLRILTWRSATQTSSSVPGAATPLMKTDMKNWSVRFLLSSRPIVYIYWCNSTGEMSKLEMDSTTVVLLSVMSLFFTESDQQVSSASSILSHQRKFSLLLQRFAATIFRILFSKYLYLKTTFTFTYEILNLKFDSIM